MKIKTLHVINDLGVGGAQRIVADIVTHLDKKMFYPAVLNLNFSQDKSVETELIKEGIEIINFSSKFKGDFGCLFFLIKVLKERKFQILHSHLFLSSFYATLAAKIAKTPIVISTEHNTSTLSTKPFYYKKAAHFYLKSNSRIFAISNAVKNTITSRLPQLERKIRVIYNGIDLTLFKDSAQRKENAIFTVGTLVRNDPRKGFFVFSNCAKRAHDSNIPVRFVAAVSNNAESDDFVKMIKMSPGRESVMGFFKKIDIFVLPSLEEGLGLAAIEAMAMGIPIIVSNAGGLIEVENHKVNGLVFEVGNDAALLKSIEFLKNSPSIAQEYVKAGLAKVKKEFSLNRMIKEIELNYMELYNS